MTVYLVVVEDRHSDVDVEVFSTEQKAVDYAEQITDTYRYTSGEEQGLTDAMVHAGWVYYRILSCEGDCIRVVARDIDRVGYEAP